MSTWYEKTLLKVKDAHNLLPPILEQIKKIDGVKDIYLWGSYVKNKNKPQSVIKNVDVIASTSFFSEDFLSVIDNDFSPLSMKKESLEEEGFDPDTVAFTKEFLKTAQYNINLWAMSTDKKLLHWGAIIDDLDEWEEIKKEAEKYAFFETTLSKKKLKTANKNTQNRWLVLYEHHINKYLREMPQGWYELKCNYKDLLSKIEKQ